MLMHRSSSNYTVKGYLKRVDDRINQTRQSQHCTSTEHQHLLDDSAWLIFTMIQCRVNLQ